MERKNASLIAFIILSVYAVLSFLPITFCSYFAEPSWTAPGAYVIQKDRFTNINFYAYNIRTITIITLIICIIGIISLILIYSGKESKFTKYGSYAPIATAILFFLICIFELNHISTNGEISEMYPKGDRGYFGIRLLWGFYIEGALLIASGVLSYLIASNRLKNTDGKKTVVAGADSLIDSQNKEKIVPTSDNSFKTGKEPVEAENNIVSNASEIREYKKLFDEGIISKDEFEEKKRQLLGF